jgi:diaminohydroxyphosphoribosylaminopyrimidine deaminase/5-amino-6-(5-phosphoribosylamino)uracil reductase
VKARTTRTGRHRAFNERDERFMRLALKLAERGRGQTHPNPVVGAVVVKNGRILARGYHHVAGGPHAEIDALAKLTPAQTRGATLYVTLEPCCHTGRTGPCTRAIVAAGITRVVAGCLDPNPLVDGRGVAALERAGVRVEWGCLEGDCHSANRTFFRWVNDGRPWVTMKAAATLDGFIARTESPAGEIEWITGPAARRAAHELRAAHQAILVGVGTVLADNPRLNVRLSRRTRRASAPLRVVLDSTLRTPPTAKLLKVGGRPPLIVAAAARDNRKHAALERRRRALERAGAEVLLVPADRHGRPAILSTLRALARRGVQSLLVEGGSRVHGAFIRARSVDEIALFVAPRIWGAGLPIASAQGGVRPLVLGPLAVGRVGGDILLRAEVARNTK